MTSVVSLTDHKTAKDNATKEALINTLKRVITDIEEDKVSSYILVTLTPEFVLSRMCAMTATQVPGVLPSMYMHLDMMRESLMDVLVESYEEIDADE